MRLRLAKLVTVAALSVVTEAISFVIVLAETDASLANRPDGSSTGGMVIV